MRDALTIYLSYVMHRKVVPIANDYAYLTSCYLAFNSVRCSAYKHDVQQQLSSIIGITAKQHRNDTGPPLNVEYVEQIFSIDAQPRARWE